jgi:uncharacterized iron-regulated membrane protein
MKSQILFSHRARRLFIILHLWLGLFLGAWFSLIGISGSVLAWRGELTGREMLARFPHEKISPNAAMIPLSQVVALARRPRGGAEGAPAVPAGNSTAGAPALSIGVPHSKMPFYMIGGGRRQRQSTLVDPYSGRVHRNVDMRSTWTFSIQQFHQRLIAGARGYVANGFLTALAVPLLLSGLWLWWPSNMAQFKARVQVKRGASLKRRLYDLHNVMGIYLYSVLFVTTVTGAMLVYQHVQADGGLAGYLQHEQEQQSAASRNQNPATGRGTEPRGASQQAGPEPRAGQPRTQQPQVPAVPVGARRLTEDELLAAARQLRPNYELTRIQIPRVNNEAAQATFALPTGLTTSENVYLDPYTGRVVEVRTTEGATRSPVRQLTRALHLGEFGGVSTKLIYTITGLIPLGLFITGVMMWWRKKRTKSQIRARRAAVNEAQIPVEIA